MTSKIEEKTRRANEATEDKWNQSKQHLSSTREMCLVTLGFPVPDTDHQKHALSLDEALDMARLYIATWLQAVCERSKEQPKPAHPKQGFTSKFEETSLPSNKMNQGY